MMTRMTTIRALQTETVFLSSAFMNTYAMFIKLLFSYVLDMSVGMCYYQDVAAACAQAFGTSEDVLASDISGGYGIVTETRTLS